MKFIADLHIHSHYSMATSKDANPENLYRWARYKGVALVGSGDFTHPGWRQELQDKLEPAGEGLYRLKDDLCRQVEEEPVPGLTPAGLTNGGNPAGNLAEGLAPAGITGGGRAGNLAAGEAATASGYLPRDATGRPVVRFIISGEISTIYKQGGRTRKVHHLILLPDLEAAAKLSRRLEEIGNLHSDGRPILGLDSRRLLEMTLEACPEAIFIPAHIWTPHFSLFGANSGFDAIEECYGDLSRYIFAVETGLSSDPPMNWRLAALDRLTLVSNSDAHSPRHLAREANLFNTDLAYPALRRALQDPEGDGFLGTLEFFPEEGKYHYDGHRNCQVCWQPAQTRSAGGVCPVCGRKLTIGVLHRIEELADREAGFRPDAARPFESLVPLPEVIAAALGMGVASKRVTRAYFNLIGTLGPELAVLREIPLEAIARVAGSLVAAAVRRMRTGEVEVHPGFDGEYGRVFLLRPEERQLYAEEPVLFKEESPCGPVAVNGEPRLFTEEAAAAPVATGEGGLETGLPGPAGATTEQSASDPSGRRGPVLKGGVLEPTSGEATQGYAKRQHKGQSVVFGVRGEATQGCAGRGNPVASPGAAVMLLPPEGRGGEPLEHMITSPGWRLSVAKGKVGEPPVLSAPARHADRRQKATTGEVSHLSSSSNPPGNQVAVGFGGGISSLNPEQRAAVVAADGPVVVVAGPGTGKTRTLVYRLAYLIQERGVAPGEIAAVTFTNKAAAEIRQRVADLLGDRQGVAALTVGNFHSICLDLLQAGAAVEGQLAPTIAQPVPASNYYRSLTVIDEVDAREILAEVLAADKGPGRRGVAALQRQISLLKGRGLFPDAPEVPDDLRSLYRAYQERLVAYGHLDYDDILLQALELPGLTPEASGTDKRDLFTYLLVDEFQDVNAVQYQLVQKWAGNGKNLFVIGDPDQAIYGFRGADYRFFGQLLQDFPAARLCHLNRNYRSTPVILRAAAGVVAHNPAEGSLAVTRAELAAASPEPPTAQSVPALSAPAATWPAADADSPKPAATLPAPDAVSPAPTAIPSGPTATFRSPEPAGRLNPRSGAGPGVTPTNSGEAGPEVTSSGRLSPGEAGISPASEAGLVSHPEGSPIVYLEAPGETAAGIAIVREIGRLVGGTTMLQAHGQGRGAKGGGPEPGDAESYSFSDLAVLCRTGRQLQFLEECFLKEGLPYRIVGRESFLEAAPVRQALAFCRCLVNPAEDFYLRQCLVSHKGIGRETGARIGELARRLGVPTWQVIGELAGGEGTPSPGAAAPANETQPCGPETLRKHLGVAAQRGDHQQTGEPATCSKRIEAFPGGPASKANYPGAFPCGPALRNHLQAFISTMASYRAALDEQPPADILARWAGERGLQEEESLNRLIRVAAGFADPASFLRGVILAGEADHERRGSKALSPEVVTLMTLHAAKGLEFPVVFIAGLEDGVLPLREHGGANLTPGEMAEERRLFYVGMTRARELLYLVAARRREQTGATVPAEPSPFLQEIPAGCLVARVWEAGGKSKGSNDGTEDDARYKQLSLF